MKDLIKYAADTGAEGGNQTPTDSTQTEKPQDVSELVKSLVAVVTKNSEEIATLKELLSKTGEQKPVDGKAVEQKPVAENGQLNIDALMTKITDTITGVVDAKFGMFEKQKIETSLTAEQKEKLKKIPGSDKFSAEQIQGIVSTWGGETDEKKSQNQPLPNVGNNDTTQVTTSYKQVNEQRKKGGR